MTERIKKIWLRALCCLFVIALCASVCITFLPNRVRAEGAASVGDVTDSFSGSAVDTSIWNIPADSAQKAEIENGALKLSKTGQVGCAPIMTHASWKDFQVEFTVVSNNTTDAGYKLGMVFLFGDDLRYAMGYGDPQQPEFLAQGGSHGITQGNESNSITGWQSWYAPCVATIRITVQNNTFFVETKVADEA